MTGNVADAIVTYIAGESWMAKDTDSRDHPTRDEVAQLAYHLYEARGREHGYDIDDWLRDETELTHHYK
jgi:Protein of unknown function (DUF2934)